MDIYTCFGIILICFVISPCVTELTCKLERASECTEELESIFNDTKAESRTDADIVSMCTQSLRSNNAISMCFLSSTAVCDRTNPSVVEANTRWNSINDRVEHFCDQECQDFKYIKTCKEKVNLTAIERGVPSEFCKSYTESRQCLEDEIDEDNCVFKGQIFDALFDSRYFSNFYRNVCLSDCSNLDETVNVLKRCYPHVENPDPVDTCFAHRNFTSCLESFPYQPCKQFPSLISTFYRYDYHGNQRLCQDEACLKARTCQSEIQRQYDSTLGYYIIQSNDTTHLKDLCLVTMRENEHLTCYNTSIMDCTSAPNHPLKAQFNELVQDIVQLCNKDCDGVMEAIPRCHGYLQYENFYNNGWSDFCRSHSTAVQCVEDLNCGLGTSMFDALVEPDVLGMINTVCTSGCTNLHEVLGAIEKCFPSLNKTAHGCSHYDAFKTCMDRHISSACGEADDILNFLFPGYTDLSIRCTTTTTIPTSSSTHVTSHFLSIFLVLMTLYQLIAWS